MEAVGAAISLRELTKFYGRHRGIEGLTFDVMPGEVVGFLGPNGSGKTTALRVLLGLLRPTAGGALLLGVDVVDAPASIRGDVGYLPGSLSLYRGMRAGDLLSFLSRMRHRDCRTRIAELAERFDLDLNARVRDLSKGNRQKVGVVQAFMHDPLVLLLDEPTSGLDPLVQREFDLLLDETRARGAAVLLSSHVLSEAEQLAHRVAILNHGRLVVVQDISALKERAVRRIDVELPAPTDPARFAALPGVGEVRSRPGSPWISVDVQGSQAELLKLVADLRAISVRTHEPSLDDIFLELVQGGGDDALGTGDEDVA